MKLMVEQASVLNGSIVNESENDKAYYISGIFSTIGEKNINGRVYPKHIWESQVLEYQNEIKSNSSNINNEQKSKIKIRAPRISLSTIKNLPWYSLFWIRVNLS